MSPPNLRTPPAAVHSGEALAEAGNAEREAVEGVAGGFEARGVGVVRHGTHPIEVESACPP